VHRVSFKTKVEIECGIEKGDSEAQVVGRMEIFRIISMCNYRWKHVTMYFRTGVWPRCAMAEH
jgi:hypothetical protein